MFEALREGGPRNRDGGGARWGCGVLVEAELGERVVMAVIKDYRRYKRIRMSWHARHSMRICLTKLTDLYVH